MAERDAALQLTGDVLRVLVSLDGYEGEAANVPTGTKIGKRDSSGDPR